MTSPAKGPHGVHPETPSNPLEGGQIGDALVEIGERPSNGGRVRFQKHDVYMHSNAESFGSALQTWGPVGGRIHFTKGPEDGQLEFSFQGQSNDVHCLVLDADRALEINLLKAYAKELKLHPIFGGGISIDRQGLVHEEFARTLAEGNLRDQALQQFLTAVDTLGPEGAALMCSKGRGDERILAYVREGRFMEFRFPNYSALNETIRPLLDSGYIVLDETDSLTPGAGIPATEIYRQYSKPR